MKHSLIILAVFSGVAYADGNKYHDVGIPENHSTNSAASSNAGASANSGSNSGFSTGDVRVYAFPAPSSATPLPGNLCPLGESLSWSIGWNFFSYARSSTRTELECLEKALAFMKASDPPRNVGLPMTGQIFPEIKVMHECKVPETIRPQNRAAVAKAMGCGKS